MLGVYSAIILQDTYFDNDISYVQPLVVYAFLKVLRSIIYVGAKRSQTEKYHQALSWMTMNLIVWEKDIRC
jgi:hypothetical protein